MRSQYKACHWCQECISKAKKYLPNFPEEKKKKDGISIFFLKMQNRACAIGLHKGECRQNSFSEMGATEEDQSWYSNICNHEKSYKT